MQRPQLITALISCHCRSLSLSLRFSLELGLSRCHHLCRSCDKTLPNVILTKPHRRLLKTVNYYSTTSATTRPKRSLPSSKRSYQNQRWLVLIIAIGHMQFPTSSISFLKCATSRTRIRKTYSKKYLDLGMV